MLWEPERESLRSQIPKFLTTVGDFSATFLMLTISPAALLTFLWYETKYQKRDLAAIGSGAKRRTR